MSIRMRSGLFCCASTRYILLMDEAFSALDPLIRSDMQNELISLQARMKKTILFITHDLDEALKLGNRVVLMKDGQVVQIGTPEEILTIPANDYVKRFVENVDKSKILTARSVLTETKLSAYLEDQPSEVLRKMQTNKVASLFVIKQDNTLLGIVLAEVTRQAVERGDKSIANIIESQVPTVTTTAPLTQLIRLLTKWPWPIPVVDKENKLQGMVVSNQVLMALAKNGD